jgi:hypothetical protein
MRYYDDEEAKDLNAAQWQLDLLKLNPEYCSWGPHEDYMWTKDDAGWNGRIIAPTWSEFGPWGLDDLNECVNFYFEVNRASEKCVTCGGNGYHTLAQDVVNTFYRHMNDRGESWNDKITQDEFEALQAEGRCKEFNTVDEVNAANAPQARGMGHDAINRWILITARLKRLGIPEKCERCAGKGYTFTADHAHASLVLWWLHPRKGCSRGIEVSRIEQAELPAIYAFLHVAAQRNAARFSKIPTLS